MQRVNLNGVDLEYDVQGSGEPLLLIHGSILADAFFPLLAEPRIANNYRRDLVSPPRLCGQCPCQRPVHDRAAGC